MLESSEHEKTLRYSNHKSPNFKDCFVRVRSADPPISYEILFDSLTNFLLTSKMKHITLKF